MVAILFATYTVMHTRKRSYFFLLENSGTGIIILAQVWDSSFQESLRLTMTQMLSFENCGLDNQHKENQLSLSLSASPSSLFLSDRIARRQSTQCLPLNKPRVITEDPVCDQWREARGTGKPWKG